MIGSPNVHNNIRESSVLTLPPKRTLKDHTHWFRSDVEFRNEVLVEEYKISELNEAHSHVQQSADIGTWNVVNFPYTKHGIYMAFQWKLEVTTAYLTNGWMKCL
jgi:hypothetical protein